MCSKVLKTPTVESKKINIQSFRALDKHWIVPKFEDDFYVCDSLILIQE